MIGDKIKSRRDELGLTQYDLEKMTGIGHRMISNYENNNSKPNDETILLFMNALQCDANYFFDIKPNQMSVNSSCNYTRLENLSTNKQRILKLFDHLDEVQQENVIARAEMYAEQNSQTIKVYRAAESDNGHTDEILNISPERLQKLKDAPESDEDL